MRVLTCLTLVALMSAVGCSSDPDLPPVENGYHVDAINGRQRDAALADRRVVYGYEWTDDGLTEYGQRHVAQIGRSVAVARRTVVVEPTGDADVDAKHRRRVIATLADLAVPDAAALVRVQRPMAYGTGGEEAANVDADTPRGGQTNGTNGGGNLGGGEGIGSGGLGIGGGGGMGGRSGGY